jgi:hypothetical protein
MVASFAFKSRTNLRLCFVYDLSVQSTIKRLWQERGKGFVVSGHLPTISVQDDSLKSRPATIRGPAPAAKNIKARAIAHAGHR